MKTVYLVAAQGVKSISGHQYETMFLGIRGYGHIGVGRDYVWDWTGDKHNAFRIEDEFSANMFAIAQRKCLPLMFDKSKSVEVVPHQIET